MREVPVGREVAAGRKILRDLRCNSRIPLSHEGHILPSVTTCRYEVAIVHNVVWSFHYAGLFKGRRCFFYEKDEGSYVFELTCCDGCSTEPVFII